jgi:very-short-patch-repair endonuclease
MNGEEIERGITTPSLPLGEGQGGVRRASAAPSEPSALTRTERPWGRPDATSSVQAARALRKRMTPQEAKVWTRLRLLRGQGFHFRRQVPIADYIVDFACLKAGLVVEIDGGQHARDDHSRKDRMRDAALNAAGFRVLRFWNADVGRDPSTVIDTVFAALTVAEAAGAAYPTPAPPLRGGKEQSHG